MPIDPAEVPSHIATQFSAPLELLKAGAAVPHLYDWQAKENPNYPLFTYHDGDQLKYITYASANSAIDRAARYILSGLSHRDGDGTPPVIAVFVNADTITSFCGIVGILRAGCTAFLISIRNGAAAVADMLQRTGASQLIMTQDVLVREVVKDALSKLSAGQVTVRDMPTFEDLFPNADRKPAKAFEADIELPKTYDMDSCAIILHSSGSTDQPKPYRWTHKRVTAWGYESMFFEWDTSRSIFGCHGVPMFHAMGTYLCSAAPMKGYIIAAFKPTRPPILPTPDAVWQGAVATKCDFFFTVPSNIEEWSRHPDKVAVLQRMRGVVFGGAPLNTEVGDALALQGVNLLPAYGMTEVGTINQTMGPQRGLDWPYWTPVRTKEFRFVPRGANQYEVVVLSNPDMPLPITNIKIDGRDGYATNDLVEPHPTRPNYWKILGRADEQIILSNGEKTNPLPLEKIVNSDPHVRCSVMFGSGKFQNGILVHPKENFAIDPNDIKEVEIFRNRIWPTIERVNSYAPQHSRIFKEMILVTSPTKPFMLNAKDLPRRNVILADYHNEIETLYKHVEESTRNGLHPPASWEEPETSAFVRAVVHDTLRRYIADDADIFHNGCDSLQATWIRNTILRALRETKPTAVNRLPMDFVFQAPTISGLARAVYANAHEADNSGTTSRSPNNLWQYVDKYSANLPVRPVNPIDRPTFGKDVVLITGTTSGFGCDTLEHLLRDDTVERVYAFNRQGSDVLERQRVQFRARGLKECLLDSPKFRMVEAVLHEPGFGLEVALLDEIRQSVTHILHNAWKVDFKLSLQSFEIDLQGARNLIDLAISSPYRQAPTVVFVSSIGVFTNYKGPFPAPEAPLHDPASPFGTGYNESKWVTEHVLQNVTKSRGVHTVVVRLGQVCGDRVGHWNEKEWFPALVKSAQIYRRLPELESNVSWVPGYEGAKAFAEMRQSPYPFLHLVHPRPVPWSTIIAPIAEELGIPYVSYQDWLTTLQQTADVPDGDHCGEQVKENPALRLVDFFSGLETSSSRKPLGTVNLLTENAARVSATLRSLPPLDIEHVQAWLAAWKRSGFLE
ncbi:acetyl-CoA synthetase-like protein [Trametes sanguinea]|nr:acetyl-CoA synthetase-like protein [Trametes sanguinea]